MTTNQATQNETTPELNEENYPMTTHEHTQDSDCAGHIIDNECQVCGAYHGDKCPECSGRGYHTPECNHVDEEVRS